MSHRWLLVALAGVTVLACSRPDTAGVGGDSAAATAIKELGRQTTEVIWNQGEVDRLGEFYAEDIVRHVPELPDPVVGLDANKEYIRGILKAFPDTHVELERIIVDGEWGAVQWVWTGTQTGDMPGVPATGKSVRMEGASIVHVVGGKAVEFWDYDDTGAMLHQLGVGPKPAE